MPTAPKSKSPNTRRTHTDRVRRHLSEEIISGKLKPGASLDEKAIAARFKVSRTPVREALRQLAASDLVEWRPRQGAIVATITIPGMIEMFEVMAELEGLCGRLAARRMTLGERNELAARHKRCEPCIREGDSDGYIALNRPFHEAIYAGAHNTYLADHAQALLDRLAPYRAYHVNWPGQLERSYLEHQQIVDAIVGGNSDSAYRLLRDHLALDGELFRDLIASLNV